MQTARATIAPADWLAQDGRFRAAAAVLLVCGIVVGLVGINTPPLDAHESFVAETAVEMHEHGNWVVPYFDHTLRLNKPPLSYWATGFVAWIAGDLPAIEPWHARLPSLGAGLGLALLTLYLGLRLYGRAVAVLAMAFFVTSSGYFTYTHDARPDMMYAFWVVAGYAAFVSALNRRRRGLTDTYWRAALMWACFGAAVLTKGPHLPLFVLLAQVLYLAAARCRPAAIYGIVRPVSGIIILLAVALPWWVALAGQIGFGTLSRSQLAGTLLHPHGAAIVKLYYLYESPMLLLPWIPVGLLACAALLRRAGRPEVAVLALPVLVTLIGLSLGAQARLVYVLPLLPLLCVLLAAGFARTSIMVRGGTPAGAAVAAVALQIMGVLAVGIWYYLAGAPAPARASLALCAGMVLAVAALAGLLLERTQRWAVTAFGAALLLCGVLWPTLAVTELPWGPERFGKYRLAQAARTHLSADTPLGAYMTSAAVFVYYTHHEIHPLGQLSEIRTMLEGSPNGQLGLFTTDSVVPELSREFAVEELERMQNGSRKIALVLLSEHRGSSTGGGPRAHPRVARAQRR